MLSAALDRLRAEQLAKIDAAELPPNSPLRAAVEAAIDRLRDRLEHDPAWVEDALGDILGEQNRTTR
jgi:hypothetical protein